MLIRVLEPEVMDTAQDAITYDDMDHAAVNEQFVLDVLAYVPIDQECPTVEFLDLGTGTARIPIALCGAADNLRVFAVDLSVEMLEIARLNVEMSPHLDRIMLAHCDAKQLELDDERFDVVISNSIVHHIPDPRTTLADAVRVCRSGGALFFRDLIRPRDDSDVSRLVQTYMADESDDARQMFDDSLRAAFTVEEIQDLVVELGFPPESVTATSDRHWTWTARK